MTELKQNIFIKLDSDNEESYTFRLDDVVVVAIRFNVSWYLDIHFKNNYNCVLEYKTKEACFKSYGFLWRELTEHTP